MLVHPIGFFAGKPLTVDSGTVNVSGVTTAHNAWLEIWTDVGGSPGAQIGADSDTINVSSAGEKAITWSTPVDLGATKNFWIVLQADGGDVNYNRHTALAGDDVDGGDFDTTAITNLVSVTSFVLRASVLLSDGRRVGNRDTGTTGVGIGGSEAAGTEITIT